MELRPGASQTRDFFARNGLTDKERLQFAYQYRFRFVSLVSAVLLATLSLWVTIQILGTHIITIREGIALYLLAFLPGVLLHTRQTGITIQNVERHRLIQGLYFASTLQLTTIWFVCVTWSALTMLLGVPLLLLLFAIFASFSSPGHLFLWELQRRNGMGTMADHIHDESQRLKNDKTLDTIILVQGQFHESGTGSFVSHFFLKLDIRNHTPQKKQWGHISVTVSEPLICTPIPHKRPYLPFPKIHTKHIKQDQLKDILASLEHHFTQANVTTHRDDAYISIQTAVLTQGKVARLSQKHVLSFEEWREPNTELSSSLQTLMQALDITEDTLFFDTDKVFIDEL